MPVLQVNLNVEGKYNFKKTERLKHKTVYFFVWVFFPPRSNPKAMVEKHAETLPCLAFICSAILLAAENLTLFSHLELLVLDCISEVF